jgi:hypothetical protein
MNDNPETTTPPSPGRWPGRASSADYPDEVTTHAEATERAA